MTAVYNEKAYEETLMELFAKANGYRTVCGYDVDCDRKAPVWQSELRGALRALNPSLPADALRAAEGKLWSDLPPGTLTDRNRMVLDYLQNGVEVTCVDEGETRNVRVKVVDYGNVDANSFVCANQWTFIEGENTCRPDVVLFVNGLPLVVIELKSPVRAETDASEGYRQIERYKREIPSFFIYNQVCVISDMLVSKAGTISADEARFVEWKTKDGVRESSQTVDYSTLFEGMFRKDRFLDLLRNFICFSDDGTKAVKILAAYHQYFAVHKAVESTVKGIGTNGKGGVFWHTQGSGKSLSMVFYAHLLQRRVPSLTLVVITDRNDLDDQLFAQFTKCSEFLRQTPQQAESRADLQRRLDNVQAHGIVFSTMGKFLERNVALSERSNIVVMADEAHRSQFGLVEKVQVVTNADGAREARIVRGDALRVRQNLPNATYIGFTGTPIESKDRSISEVFGNYIDVYDMTQAVEDGATRPIYYESRVVKLKLDEGMLKRIDDEYDRLAETVDADVIRESKREMSGLETVLCNPETVQSVAEDIVEHYCATRRDLLTGKAMIVAYNRRCAVDIYKEIMRLCPGWENKVHVVMTEGPDDEPEMFALAGDKTYRKGLAAAFKDDESDFKIAIVVDMWLTGFDVPSLATMYVYKPMSGHNLMQAIARVNRVYEDKEGGLIVDYIGIAGALKQAMRDYTARDRDRFGNPDISGEALKRFREKLDVCRSLLHGYEYDDFFTFDNAKMTAVMEGVVNFLLDPARSETCNDFRREALLLTRALSLCASIVTERDRAEASFMECARVMVARILNPSRGAVSLKDVNKRITDLIRGSVSSEGIVNLFKADGNAVSLFKPEYLNEIAGMEHSNIAYEILKNLLAEHVEFYKRRNIVKSEKFSELMQQAIRAYLNGQITNRQVIEELLKIADMVHKADVPPDPTMTDEEVAFYDALSRPEAILDFFTNDELIKMTRDLTETLQRNRTIDWTHRSDARAQMRIMVKRLLRKYKYPPEEVDGALDIVMKQCEMWADAER